MPTIGSLADSANEVITVPVGSEAVTFTVALGRITGEWQSVVVAAMNDDLADGEDAEAVVIGKLLEVVTEWDIFDREPGEGEDPATVPRAPLTYEAAQQVPALLWTKLGRAIADRITPPEASAGGSFAG